MNSNTHQIILKKEHDDMVKELARLQLENSNLRLENANLKNMYNEEIAICITNLENENTKLKKELVLKSSIVDSLEKETAKTITAIQKEMDKDNEKLKTTIIQKEVIEKENERLKTIIKQTNDIYSKTKIEELEKELATIKKHFKVYNETIIKKALMLMPQYTEFINKIQLSGYCWEELLQFISTKVNTNTNTDNTYNIDELEKKLKERSAAIIEKNRVMIELRSEIKELKEKLKTEIERNLIKCSDCKYLKKELSELQKQVFDPRRQIWDLTDKVKKLTDINEKQLEKIAQLEKKSNSVRLTGDDILTISNWFNNDSEPERFSILSGILSPINKDNEDNQNQSRIFHKLPNITDQNTIILLKEICESIRKTK